MVQCVAGDSDIKCELERKIEDLEYQSRVQEQQIEEFQKQSCQALNLEKQNATVICDSTVIHASMCFSNCICFYAMDYLLCVSFRNNMTH